MVLRVFVSLVRMVISRDYVRTHPAVFSALHTPPRERFGTHWEEYIAVR